MILQGFFNLWPKLSSRFLELRYFCLESLVLLLSLHSLAILEMSQAAYERTLNEALSASLVVFTLSVKNDTSSGPISGSQAIFKFSMGTAQFERWWE